MGWKETVRMNPGEVITVDMKFDMPSGAKHSPRLKASYGIKGAEYVWHCHILEHEEHDMMHALVVTGGTHD
jgi:spore coat protein A